MPFTVDQSNAVTIVRILTAIFVILVLAAVTVVGAILRAGTAYQKGQLDAAIKTAGGAFDLRVKQMENTVTYLEGRLGRCNDEVELIESRYRSADDAMKRREETIEQLLAALNEKSKELKTVVNAVTTASTETDVKKE